MSTMSPEGDALPTGNMPMGTGPRGGGGGGKRSNATGASSRIAVDTRDLAKMKDLVTGNVKAMKDLAKAIRELDPALGSLKAVNAELDKMHQMFGLVGNAAGSKTSGGSGGVGAANQKGGTSTAQSPASQYGVKSYTPAAANSGANGGYNFGGSAGVNLLNPGMRPAAAPSYSQRMSSYFSQPISDPKSQYAGMSRGKALGIEAGASAIAGAISFGGSYGQKMLDPTADRSLMTNRISQYTGGTGSYSQQQSIGLALSRAGSANQGFADVNAAGAVVSGVGGGGAMNAVKAVGSANWISQSNPNLSLAQAAQGQNSILGVSAQNKLRGFGVQSTSLGSQKINSQATIDAYIKQYEKAAGHKLSSAEIESGNTPGYGLYRDLMAVFQDPSVIPSILNRWHVLNGSATDKNNSNNLRTTVQTNQAAGGNLATAANPGTLKGLTKFTNAKTDVANAMTKAIGAGGDTAQNAIATAVGIGMAVDSLRGIAGTLGRIEKILLGTGASRGAGGLLNRVFNRGKTPGGGPGGGPAGPGALSRFGTFMAQDGAAAGPLAVAGTAVAGLAIGGAIGTAISDKYGVGFAKRQEAHYEAVSDDVDLATKMASKAQSRGFYKDPNFPMDAWKQALAAHDGKAMAALLGKYTSDNNLGGGKSYSIRGPGGASPGGGTVSPDAVLMQSLAGSAVAPPPPSGAVGQAVSTATSYVGKPYRSGGSNPGTGFDCAGLIQYAYKQVGVNLPNTAGEMSKVGIAITAAQARAGDLIFTAGDGGPGGGHVGLYLGNGRMLDSPATGGAVRVTQANLSSAVSIRRVATGGAAGGRASAVAGAGGGMKAVANGKGAPTKGFGGASAAPSGAGGNVALAQKMAAAMGWTGSQWNDLYAVWNQEGSFKTTAGSPNHAYGIAQADPGSKMASAGPDWMTNPATQIKWGLNYISGRYKSPAAVLAHKHQTDSNLGATGLYAQPGGWYEKGSWNIVKDQIANLHKGEMVLPQKTANLVREMVGGDTSRGTATRVSGGGRTVPIQLTYVVQSPTSVSEIKKHAKTLAAVLWDDHQIDLVAAGGASK